MRRAKDGGHRASGQIEMIARFGELRVTGSGVKPGAATNAASSGWLRSATLAVDSTPRSFEPGRCRSISNSASKSPDDVAKPMREIVHRYGSRTPAPAIPAACRLRKSNPVERLLSASGHGHDGNRATGTPPRVDEIEIGLGVCAPALLAVAARDRIDLSGVEGFHLVGPVPRPQFRSAHRRIAEMRDGDRLGRSQACNCSNNRFRIHFAALQAQDRRLDPLIAIGTPAGAGGAGNSP